MTVTRIMLLCSLLFIVVGCGSSDEMVCPPTAQNDLGAPDSSLKSLVGQVSLIDDGVWGHIVRDNLNSQEFLNLDATSPYDYDDVVTETGPGGAFEGWRIASEADLQALGVAADVVPGSTDAAMLVRVEELRDWFGNVRLSSTHHYTRGLIVDQVDLGEPNGVQQLAFSLGRRLNVEPNEVDFRISGWGPISDDESTYLVREVVKIPFDIKPGSCPNPINPKSKGVLPVAILGTAEFDVLDIDVSSLLLEGVPPIRSSIEDVTAPFVGDECDCAEEGPDGYDDLTLKFRTQEIVAAIWPIASGDERVLTISGTLLDGTPFEASDCVVVVGGQKNPLSVRN